ncbi:MAG: metalloendopeptidase, partial [Alistipes sp.]|nr:metalloendopeptidase [Alistipes sp.]
MRYFIQGAVLLLICLTTACSSTTHETAEEPPVRLVYGLPADDYRLETGEIRPGQTVGGILGGYGITARTIDR